MIGACRLLQRLVQSLHRVTAPLGKILGQCAGITGNAVTPGIGHGHHTLKNVLINKMYI